MMTRILNGMFLIEMTFFKQNEVFFNLTKIIIIIMITTIIIS